MSKNIPHDEAHDRVDALCMAGEYAQALAILQRAERDGRTGSLSSLRTMNRVLNMRERLDYIAACCQHCCAEPNARPWEHGRDCPDFEGPSAEQAWEMA